MIHTPMELRPQASRILPMMFMLVILGGFAIYVPQDQTLAIWIRVLVPIACVAAIAGVLLLWRGSRRARIVIDADGIKQWKLFSYREIAWSEITHYRYLSVKQPAVAHGRGGSGLVGLVSGALAEAREQRQVGPNRYFGLGHIELYSAASPPFKIGKHPFFGPQSGYVDLSDAIGLIVEEVHQRLAAKPTRFAPFALEETTLQQANGSTINIAAIDHVMLHDNGKIIVTSRQMRQPWAALSIKTVDNSILLVQQLARRGVHVSVAPAVFMPLSMRDVLASRSANRP